MLGYRQSQMPCLPLLFHRRSLSVALLAPAFLLACGSDPESPVPQPSGEAESPTTAQACPDEDRPCPITRIATQNAGTTTTLSLVASEPSEDVRAVCADWYSNNLCLLSAEIALHNAILQEAPDLLFLQEMWHQPGCADPARPEETGEAPYVCAADASPLERSQLGRVLPENYLFACAHEYPDNCIAFREGTFLPLDADGSPAQCDGVDCSAHMIDNPASCGRDGRLAYLRGTTAEGPAIAVTVHTNAGINEDDRLCREHQLQAIEEVLLAESEGSAIFMGGDFNLSTEPPNDMADEAAFDKLNASLGLTPLPVDGVTHLLAPMQLDRILLRTQAPASPAACTRLFLNPSEDNAIFDHAFVTCR